MTADMPPCGPDVDQGSDRFAIFAGRRAEDQPPPESVSLGVRSYPLP